MNLRVLDSNIILEEAYSLVSQGSADNTAVVIPETVLDEVESKKSGFTELAWQAREFGRLMTRAGRKGTERTDYGSVTTLEVEGTTVLVVTLDKYNIPEGLDPKNVNDYKIIDVARVLSETTPTVLVTNDVGCNLKAEALGIKVASVKLVEKTEYAFTKTVEIPFELFSNVNNAPVLTVDPNYTKETYNYVFTSPDTEQKKLAYVDQVGKIKVMGKETENEIRKQAMPPINTGQQFMSRAILDQLVDVIVVEAKAGTGKTVTAISSAMKLVDTNTPFESIKYVRASVTDLEKEEEVGFLPGLEEKFSVFLHPMADTLEAIAKKSNSNSQLKGEALDEKIQADIIKMTARYGIESMITLGMRGRTFSDTVIIIDEAQNMSKASLQKVITRLGKNVKLIILGSNRQIDHAYLNKYNNGLSVILENCTEENDFVRLSAVHLDSVVRSKTAEWAENLFSK